MKLAEKGYNKCVDILIQTGHEVYPNKAHCILQDFFFTLMHWYHMLILEISQNIPPQDI